MSKKLSPVIRVDAEKCVNCHTCISVCPVKFCMDGSGDVIEVNDDLCIGCGQCVSACTHEARSIQDDFAAFMEACRASVPIVAIAAPAVASAFPGEYLNLNGYLKSLGVEAVFDVSFGAELTVKSYKHHIESNRPETVIAQPCPAVVSYIELYRPELLPHLAPYDSPMAHTMKMIREFYPQYRNHRIAAISPCVAKRREFDEIGLGDYNITFHSLSEAFKSGGKKLSAYEAVPYANPPAERAVLFPVPGGLTRTFLRDNPDIHASVRKVEGPELVYEYLDELPSAMKKGNAPLLVDCLNCARGCNGGPGTDGVKRHFDELEKPVEKRAEEYRKAYGKKLLRQGTKKLQKALAERWNPELYRRSYLDLSSGARMNLPDEREIEKIYESMLKYEEKDILNCSACGYGSCREMAVAIHNGLNKAENCHRYQQEIIKRANSGLASMSADLDSRIREALATIAELNSSVETVNGMSDEQASAIEESSASISQMISSIGRVSSLSGERQKSVTELIRIAESGKQSLGTSLRAVENIAHSIEQVGNIAGIIDDIAANTNLLSINASIEAAHAGNAGRGFAVVATEIRRLAESAGKNSHLISDRLGSAIREIRETAGISEQTGESIRTIITMVEEVGESLESLINAMYELSSGSDQITKSLAELKQIAADFKSAYRDMFGLMDGMQRTMAEIAEISGRNMQTITAETED